MATHRTPAWIAVDWGSSNLRAWALSAENHVLAHTSSARGMLGLAADEFEDVLRVLINDWLPTDAGSPMPVLICGMAGARQGWKEAAYLPLPEQGDTSCDVLESLGEQLTPVQTRDPRIEVAIVPGLCQTPQVDTTRSDARVSDTQTSTEAGISGEISSRDFDVMRGEETQLAGLVAGSPDYSGAVCLPGTHAKWARLEQGQIVCFSTYMSGELFKLLSQDSVLKHSVCASDLDDMQVRHAYLAGIDSAMASPARITAQLFGIRARDLLDETLPGDADRHALLGARLSGLVLGLELAGATATLSDDAPITLIGDAMLCQRYQIALEHLGYQIATVANAEMILAGLGRIQHARHTHESAPTAALMPDAH